MMGTQAAPERLFYDFCLDDHVPADHLLRQIDGFLDLSSVRGQLAEYYSHIGRPSIAPELMIRMLIVGYCFAIRSERRLCEEVGLNLAYRWFCRSLDSMARCLTIRPSPLNRTGRFRESNLLRHVFETVVRRCMDEGLVGGEGFAVDASLIEADANKQRSIPGDEWNVDDAPPTLFRPSRIIWPGWMTRPLGQPVTRGRSSFHRPIRQHSGPVHIRGQPFLLMPTTI